MSDPLTPLLQAGEGFHTEFKQSLDKSFVEEACAFANSGGGRILLGVADNGVIKGIDTGISRFRQAVAEHGGTELELRFNDFFTATFRSKIQVAQDVTGEVSEQVAKILITSKTQPKTKGELLEVLGLANVYMNYKRHVFPLIEKGLIEMTIPERPQSRLPKYRLTGKGREILRREGSDE